MAFNQDTQQQPKDITGGERWVPQGTGIVNPQDPTQEGSVQAQPTPSALSTPTGGQDWAGPWDANKVSSYFASRGVAPNSTSPDYWAGKWNEWGSKDPNYFMQRLSTADEFNPGGQPSGQAPSQGPTMMGSWDMMKNTGIAGGAQGNPAYQYEQGSRDSSLFDQLMGRARQGLNVSASDPVIKNQVDSFRNSQTRGVKDYLSQAAEHGGQNANMDAASRSAYEKAGSATSGMQAQLMQNELNSRRAEIQQALTEAGSLLSQQDQLALQRELGLINAQQSGTQIGNAFNLGQQQINSGNDQFMANFGLNSTNQASYWDAIRRGLL